MAMTLYVECYAGYKADERPLRFRSQAKDSRTFEVVEVLDQWYGIGYRCFRVRADDGNDPDHYDQAGLIVLGVSRSGKTPTSLYLALHFGIYTANFPLTPDELDSGRIPAQIIRHRHKLFGLTIDPERLAQIRAERYAQGRYAQLKQCQYEVRQAEAIFRRERIPFVNSTHMSIEEIATTILHKVRFKRDLM